MEFNENDRTRRLYDNEKNQQHLHKLMGNDSTRETFDMFDAFNDTKAFSFKVIVPRKVGCE